MLDGSFSIAEESTLRWVSSTVGLRVADLASGVGAAAASGLAAGLSSGVVLQAANKTTRLAALTRVRILARIFISSSWLFDERPPGRLAYIPCRRAQALFHAPVGRHRRQHSASVHDRSYQDHPAVRRKARRLVAVAILDDLALPVAEVEQRDL